MVIVGLLLFANCVYVDVDSVNGLGWATRLVVDLRKLPVKLQKLLLTNQSAVRALTFGIAAHLQLLNQFFLLPAFRKQHFVLLLESLVRSYLISNQVTLYFLGSVLDKPVKALPRGVCIALPRHFELNKVLILLFASDSVPFDAVNSVPAVLLALFGSILLRSIFLLAREVLGEAFRGFSLPNGPVFLVRFTLIMRLHRVYLDRIIAFLFNLPVLSVRTLHNCFRPSPIMFSRSYLFLADMNVCIRSFGLRL